LLSLLVVDDEMDVASRRELADEIGPKLEFLRDPASYPEHPSRVDAIETHMSWVFLTDQYAYKLKKPVRLPFLDFVELEDRKRACEASIRLNRRLAPGVYVGVVALRRARDGSLVLGHDGTPFGEPIGEPVEWLEKMRRLPSERQLDRMIERRSVSASHVRDFARVLGRFYAAARPEPVSVGAYRLRIVTAIDEDYEALCDPAWDLPRERLLVVRSAEHHFLRDHAAMFSSRIDAGRIIEGHGDLRPEHIYLVTPPVVIDCIEFNRTLRILDAADELAYLALECERLGAPWIGPLVFETYAAETGDTPPHELVAFYKAHRALLRAKLAVWHIRDHPASTHPLYRQRALEYLALAERHLGLPT
jgi:aminoglycoside phosphotransferase family enzyme